MGKQIKPTLGGLIRLIRGARESNPDKLRVPSPWQLTNLKICDTTGSLPAFNIDGAVSTVRLQVVIGHPTPAMLEEAANDEAAQQYFGPRSGVVAEMWRISIGGGNDEDDAEAPNAVFVHALYSFLRISELYNEVRNRDDVTVQLVSEEPHVREDHTWERNSWTIPDGISVQLATYRLWKADLRNLEENRLHFKNGSIAITPDIASPQTDAHKGSSAPVTIPPLAIRPGSLDKPSSFPNTSPNLGPMSDPQPVGSFRSTSFPTPPFNPSSFTPASLGSNAGGSLLGSHMDFNLGPSVIGNHNIHDSVAENLANQSSLPGLVPLVAAEDAVASPVMRREDGFLAMMTGGGGSSSDSEDEGTVKSKRRDSTTDGYAMEDDVDCTSFLMACDDCVLQRRTINVHDFIQSSD